MPRCCQPHHSQHPKGSRSKTSACTASPNAKNIYCTAKRRTSRIWCKFSESIRFTSKDYYANYDIMMNLYEDYYDILCNVVAWLHLATPGYAWLWGTTLAWSTHGELPMRFEGLRVIGAVGALRCRLRLRGWGLATTEPTIFCNAENESFSKSYSKYAYICFIRDNMDIDESYSHQLFKCFKGHLDNISVITINNFHS